MAQYLSLNRNEIGKLFCLLLSLHRLITDSLKRSFDPTFQARPDRSRTATLTPNPTLQSIRALTLFLLVFFIAACQSGTSSASDNSKANDASAQSQVVLDDSKAFLSELSTARQELEQYYASVSEAAAQQADSASNRNVNHINSMIMKTVVMSDEIQDLEKAIQENIAVGGNAAELKQLTEALQYKVSTNKERISEYTRLAKGLVEKEN